MKKCFLLLCLIQSISSIGQSDRKIQACDSNLIFTFVEQIPTFIGGIDSIKTLIRSNVKIDKSISGTCVFSLTVNCKGEAFDYNLIRGENPEIDSLILATISKVDHLNVGKQNGNKVDCYLFIPIKIRKGRIK